MNEWRPVAALLRAITHHHATRRSIFTLAKTPMITSSDEKQSSLIATIGPRDSEANAVLAGELEPTFLGDEGPYLDIPLFITRTNARELFGLRPGETVAQAVARKSSEG